MKEKYNLIFLGIGLILSSIFHIIGSFHNKINKFETLPVTLAWSYFYAFLSYSVKVPSIFYFGNDFSIVFIYVFFMFSSFICVLFYSKFILNENLGLHSYIIFSCVVILLLLNYYLDSLYKNKKIS